jgi:polysaccharide pyruvyl transferase WcaK-like protein
VPSSHFSVTKQELDVDGLLEIYADMSFIIASRMLSAIFALNVCTPAIALAYDEGSKWKILEDIGMPQSQIINVSKLPTVSLEKEFNDAWERRDNVMTKVNNNLDKYLYEDTEKHFVYARKFYDKYFQKK